MSRRVPLLLLLLCALPLRAADRADAPLPPPLAPSVIPQASSPQMAAPGATEAPPQLSPQVGVPALSLAAPSALPYFAQALVKLGAPAELAQRLAVYQESRHPGDQDKVYHGLQHSRDVPDLTSLALERLPAGQMTDGQKALLIVAAAFHDIDPARPPNTPASVTRTTAYLASDPESRELLRLLGARFGFTPAQASALIDATNFNPNAELQQKLDEEFRRKAKDAFGGEAAWALKWGPRLSFFDKAATYVGGPKSAERQVKGLANELRQIALVASGKPGGPSDEQMVKGTPAFLKSLRESPDFALLPPRLQSHFADVSKHFELKAQGLPSPWDADAAQARGPPAVDAVSAAQADFRRSGWMLLPPGAVFTPDEARLIVGAADAHWPSPTDSIFRTWEFFDGRDWRVNNRQTPEVVALVQRAMGRLHALVERVTPGEGLVLIGVEMRLGSDKPTGIHVDGSYVTATITLRGPGTIIFDDSERPIRTVRARVGEAAVITNSDRAYLTDADGTIHASPPPVDPKRVVFVIRWRAARTNEIPRLLEPNSGTPAQRAKKTAQEAREKARIRAVADAVREKPASEAAQKAGLKGIWQKLFE